MVENPHRISPAEARRIASQEGFDDFVQVFRNLADAGKGTLQGTAAANVVRQLEQIQAGQSVPTGPLASALLQMHSAAAGANPESAIAFESATAFAGGLAVEALEDFEAMGYNMTPTVLASLDVGPNGHAPANDLLAEIPVTVGGVVTQRA